MPQSKPKWAVSPFSDQNGAKTLPNRAANTYIAYKRVYPPGGGGLSINLVSKSNQIVGILLLFSKWQAPDGYEDLAEGGQ